MALRVVENLKADFRDITTAIRSIVNRHISSIKGYIGGGFGILRR